MTITEAKTQLEAIIDHFGISSTVAQLSDIVSEKADHVRENWQDEPLAKNWDKVSNILSSAQLKVSKTGV